MKFTAWFFLAFVVLSGCSHKEIKHVQVPVPSCFSEGDDLGKFCKSQRVLDDSRIAITRCIGSANKTAAASLRGKCVEKVCALGSANDCEIRGEIAVLDEYSQLVRDQAFNDEEPANKTMMATSSPAGTSKKTAKSASAKVKGKKGKGKKQAAAVEAVATNAVAEKAKEWDVDPLAKLPPEPAKPEPVAAAPAPKKAPASEAEMAASSTPQPMDVVLKPAKNAKKSGKRDPASVQVMDSAFKKVCVAKSDMAAPEILRGKCATRTCNGDNCTYQGRKEMFDYMASR